MMGNIKKSFSSQQFRSGAYSTFITVLVIAIVVVINMLFSKLDLSVDLSKQGLFTLSKETKKIIKDNKEQVSLYYMVSEGDEQDYIKNVLREYAKASGKIKLKKIDPVVNPGFATKYEISDEISSNDVIVVNENTKASRYVSANSMYYTQQDYSTYQNVSYLDVEGQITSAIQGVTSGVSTKMYVVKGHGEQEVATTLNTSFEKLNIKTEELELIKAKEVPKDCDILYINGAVSDLTDNEKDILLKYLKAGGYAVINMEYTTEKLKNLEEVLSYYGIKANQGIICETAGNYYQYPNFIVTNNGTDDITSDMKGYTIVKNSIGLSIQKDMRSSLTLSELQKTSDDAYLKTDPANGSAEKESTDLSGPFSTGIFAKETVDSGETRLAVFSSADTFAQEFVGTSQLDNINLIKSSLSALIKSDIKEVSIEPESLSYSYITISVVQQMVWGAVLVIILPLAILGSGFAIWMLRRKK